MNHVVSIQPKSRCVILLVFRKSLRCLHRALGRDLPKHIYVLYVRVFCCVVFALTPQCNCLCRLQQVKLNVSLAGAQVSLSRKFKNRQDRYLISTASSTSFFIGISEDAPPYKPVSAASGPFKSLHLSLPVFLRLLYSPSGAITLTQQGAGETKQT